MLIRERTAAHIGHRVLTALAIALVLTVGLPSGASAALFFCGSGDVGCLSGSIRSANEAQGRTPSSLRRGRLLGEMLIRSDSLFTGYYN